MADKSQWFRVFTRITDSKKIHALSDAHFRWVILFWAEARKNDGILPPVEDMEFHLRRPAIKIQKAIDELTERRFIEVIDGHLVPHDWDEHQREETSSTDRVKRHRERKRNGGETPTETVSETRMERDETPPREEKRRVAEQNIANGTFHLDLACAEFIAAYPEKGRKKQGLIEHWYVANLGSCVDPEKLHREIMAGLARAIASKEWADADGKYICGMLQFLEGKRWLESWPPADKREETPHVKFNRDDID